MSNVLLEKDTSVLSFPLLPPLFFFKVSVSPTSKPLSKRVGWKVKDLWNLISA